MMRNILNVAAGFLILAALPVRAEQAGAEIMERYRETLYRLEKPEPSEVERYVVTLGEDGRWSDIDYADRKPSQWHPWEHVQRLRDISLQLSLGRTGRLSEADLEEAAIRALDHWLAHRYQSANWWHNQIGIPRSMRDAAILLEGRLNPERRAGLLEVIAQYGTVRATGANLLWLGEIALHYGCLTGDEEKVADAARRIRGEITVGQREGIQDDWSFFQHGERLQTFAYGLSYVRIAISLGWQLRGTPWEFSADEIAILSRFLLEGMQWMMRGTFTVPSTMDRSAARPGGLKVELLPYVELWAEVDSGRREELETFVGRLAGTGKPLEGFRHFGRADFTVYHRPGFSFFVKTISDRTHATESINLENLLGGRLHAGDHYLLRDGDEYFDLMPVWDWDRIPGMVAANGLDRIERRPFAGGIGDGSSGMAAMDTAWGSETEATALAVRRSWFFHGDVVVALVGGWELSDETFAPYAVLDQSRLRGDVSVLTGAGRWQLLEEGEHELEAPAAILHGDVAWFPLNAPAVSIRLGPAHGSWYTINRNHSDAPVSAPVFLASIEYPSRPESGGFAVVPGIGAEEARRLVRQPAWKVTRNDRSVQAVEFEEGVGMAAFFEAGAIELGGIELSVSRACLVLRKEEKLLVADPAMKGGPVEIRWLGATRTVELPDAGKGIAWDSGP